MTTGIPIDSRTELAARLTELAQLARSAQIEDGTVLRPAWRASVEARRLAQSNGWPSFARVLRLFATEFADLAGAQRTLSSTQAALLASWCNGIASLQTRVPRADEIEILLDALPYLPALESLETAARIEIAMGLREELSAGVRSESGEAPADATARHADADERLTSAEPVAAESSLAITACVAVEPPIGLDDDTAAMLAELGIELDDLELAALAATQTDPMLPGRERGAKTLEAQAGQSHALAGETSDPGLGTETERHDERAWLTDNAEELSARRTDSGLAFGPIWIAPEELELMQTAFAEQLLPVALAWDAALDAQDRDRLRDDVAYQLSLVGNALDMLGTPALASVNATLQRISDGADADPELVVRVVAAMLNYLQAPSAEGADTLIDVLVETPLASSGISAELRSEAARLRIGLDPARAAQRKRVAEAGDLSLQPARDVLANVLESMLRELPGNATRLGIAIRELVCGGAHPVVDEARRIAHTLKGDANTVGILGLANLTHSLEDILIELLRVPDRLPDALPELLLEVADCIEECADHLLGRGPAPLNLASVYQQTLNWANALLDGDVELATAESVDAPTPAPADTSTAPAEATGTASMAVDASLLDELQRLSGELLVLGRQVGQRLDVLDRTHRELGGEIRNERELVGALDDLVAMRGAALQSTRLAAGSQADALELDQYNELHTVSRRILEANADSDVLARAIRSVLSDIETLRSRQEQISDAIQRTVGRTRTVALESVLPRLQRIVRQTARSVDKSVELVAEGMQLALDAEILDRLVEPLSHVLRNAVDHGIENSTERLALGKPAVGRILVRATTVGDAMLLHISDDGRGLDLTAIRTKAESLGVIDSVTTLSDEMAARLILTPGFSTRQQVSHVSGRGVGMDIVNQRVQELRGSLNVSSHAGAGAAISIRLPLSRTAADVIIARGHEVSIALVAGAVSRILALGADDIAVDDSGGFQIKIDERTYPACTIEALFDRTEMQSLPGVGPCLGLLITLANETEQVLCVRQVDEVLRAVIKPISPMLPPIPAIRGMTQLSDGRLAPVVDVDTLLDLRGNASSWSWPDTSMSATELPRIVVADDSLSVRRALQQLMQDAGYDVVAARDGMEAVQLIEQRVPAAVLLDLEMPRLNGLEVCRHVRTRASTRNVPVVMITSRAGDRHRNMAADAGVTRLLGKPYVEDELVRLVGELVTASAASQTPAVVEDKAYAEILSARGVS